MPSRAGCPYCGASVSAEARYCDRCGTPLSQATPATPRRLRERTARRMAIWAFLLTLMLIFGTGTVGGFRYQAGHWPLSRSIATATKSKSSMIGLSLPSLSKSDSSALAESLRSVVSINVLHGPHGSTAGSGFVMDLRGHVVTAAHVVEGVSCVSVLDNNGRIHQGTVLMTRADLDIALVRVPGLVDAPAHLEFGDSVHLPVPADVYVLGNPLGVGNTVPLPAMVNQLHDQQMIGERHFGNLIQISGPVVMEGTSGGPLVEKSTGRVVGVLIAGSDGPIAWAIPAEEVKALLAEWADLRTGAPCATIPADRRTKVQLAVIAPRSGVDAIDGADLINGVNLALRDMEAALQAAGFEVTLLPLDDQGSPDVGREKAETVVANPNVIGVVGSLGNQVTYAIAEGLGDRLVLVAPTAGADNLTSRGWPNVNRVVANADRQEQAAARFAQNRLQVSGAFVINDGTVDGIRQANLFEAAALSIDLTLSGRAKLSTPINYSELKDRIVESKAGAVYYGGRGEAGFRLVQGLRQEGLTLPIIGGQSLYDVRFQGLTGPTAESVYFTRLTAEPSQTFQKHFESVLGKPTRGYAAYSYDAATLILSALVRYGEAHPAEVPPRDELQRMVRETRGYPGLTSWITFDGETGENKTAWVHLFEWKQGFPELVENMQ